MKIFTLDIPVRTTFYPDTVDTVDIRIFTSVKIVQTVECVQHKTDTQNV